MNEKILSRVSFGQRGDAWNMFRALLFQLLLLSPVMQHYTWSWESAQHADKYILLNQINYPELQHTYATDLIWTLDDDEVNEFDQRISQITEEDMQRIEQEAYELTSELHPQLVQAGITVSFKTLLYAAVLIWLFYFLRKWTEKFQDRSNKQMRKALWFTFIVAGLWFAFVVYPELQHKVPYGREIAWWVKKLGGQAWGLVKKHWWAVVDDIYTNEENNLIRIWLALLIWSILTWIFVGKAKLPKKWLMFIIFSAVWYYATHIYNAGSEVVGEWTEVVTGTEKKDPATIEQQQGTADAESLKRNLMQWKKEITYQDEFIQQLFVWAQTLPINFEKEWSFHYQQYIPSIEWVPAQKKSMNVDYAVWETWWVTFFVAYISSDRETGIIRIGNSVIKWKPWVAYAENQLRVVAHTWWEADENAYPQLGYILWNSDASKPAKDQPDDEDVLLYLNQIMSLPLPKQ